MNKLTFQCSPDLQAYQEWKKDKGDEENLPGLPFTHEQLFFLKGAQVYRIIFTFAAFLFVFAPGFAFTKIK